MTALEHARRFLLAELAPGPVPTLDVHARAAAAGISERTLDRARKLAGVVAKRDAFRGGWRLRLESSPSPQPQRAPEPESAGLTVAELADRIDAWPEDAAGYLADFAALGLVEERGGRWTLTARAESEFGYALRVLPDLRAAA